MEQSLQLYKPHISQELYSAHFVDTFQMATLEVLFSAFLFHRHIEKNNDWMCFQHRLCAKADYCSNKTIQN